MLPTALLLVGAAVVWATYGFGNRHGEGPRDFQISRIRNKVRSRSYVKSDPGRSAAQSLPYAACLGFLL
jgi:hypothetical protein